MTKGRSKDPNPVRVTMYSSRASLARRAGAVAAACAARMADGPGPAGLGGAGFGPDRVYVSGGALQVDAPAAA